MMLPAEFEDLLEARAVEIELLLHAVSQAPDAAKLLQLRTCLETGAELQQRLSHRRNQVSSDLHHVNQMALALNPGLYPDLYQDVPDNVAGDPGQPRIQPLELHG